MAEIRKPLQGVWNVVRFNWHFYVFSIAGLLLVFVLSGYLNENLRFYFRILCLLGILPILISLAATFYVYDLSDLYKLRWFNDLNEQETKTIVNINAGFDETSVLLQEKYKSAKLFVFDFYDASKHTEISIKRARKAYPPYPNTQQISTAKIPLENDFADKIFAVLSAHEIRKPDERAVFFAELQRILKPNGQIIVVEHLRDAANFFAYNIGFFHFYSKSAWRETFSRADLKLKREIKITPFISAFILEKI